MVATVLGLFGAEPLAVGMLVGLCIPASYSSIGLPSDPGSRRQCTRLTNACAQVLPPRLCPSCPYPLPGLPCLWRPLQLLWVLLPLHHPAPHSKSDPSLNQPLFLCKRLKANLGRTGYAQGSARHRSGLQRWCS